MTPKKPKNAAHSIRQRLLTASRKTGEDFQLLLTRYAVERLLYRLSESEHANSFVLKGAMLFALWTGEMHRPTRDVDFLGFGENSDERLTQIFRSLCNASHPEDGLAFHPDSVSVDPIREEDDYGGKRVKIEVRLEKARVSLQVDVGFGDAITPTAVSVEYPTLLGMESPKLRAYPKETVVAEKLEALVKLGLANSRMKDFYDLLVMSRLFSFKGSILTQAVTATFARRGTVVPTGLPVGLTATFAADDSKRKQWAAFVRRSGLEEKDLDLAVVVQVLANFLEPVITAAAGGKTVSTAWTASGPWG